MKSNLILIALFFLLHWARAAQVTLRVNMTGETLSAAGVHVAGSFQSEIGLPADWSSNSTQLADPDGDLIYEITLQLPMGAYQYKFLNGNTWPTAETNLTACGTGSDYNRLLLIGFSDTVLPVAKFNRCNTPATHYNTHWWNDAVFYEVFVRSFYDSNGDGRGDFDGLTAKLDYLNDGNPATTNDLGITGIWLMPIMPSPSYHGYDVTNYKGIESDYGTMSGFENFLSAAHQRGIKVIIDLVLNHTSNQHSWFTQSAANAAGPYRDWYIWSPTNPSYPGPWGQSVWSQNNGSYNFGLFWSGMPDLNWRKPEVKAALWDAVQFWLGKGVDGFRLDAVKYLVEDSLASAASVQFENTMGTFSVLQEFGLVVRTAKPDAFTIGEAWSASADVVPYLTENRLDACFEFDQALAIVNSVNTGNATSLRHQLVNVDQLYPRLQYGTFLTNHDQERVFSTLGGNLAKMKQAASLYLTLPGVPFLYYGEEVGMLGTGADEDKRKPMQWTAGTHAGFTTGTPWRSLNSNYTQFNVATQESSDTSLLSHYKKLIAIRNQEEVLRKGYYLPTTSTSVRVLGYGRVYGQEGVLMVANLGTTPIAAAAVSCAVSSLGAGIWYLTDLATGAYVDTLEINASGGFTGFQVGTLAANQTRILKLSPTPSSVKRHDGVSSISVFPNPAGNRVMLLLDSRCRKGKVQVFDLDGQCVANIEFLGNLLQLDTHSWKSGSYFFKIESDDVSEVRHIRVSH